MGGQGSDGRVLAVNCCCLSYAPAFRNHSAVRSRPENNPQRAPPPNRVARRRARTRDAKTTTSIGWCVFGVMATSGRSVLRRQHLYRHHREQWRANRENVVALRLERHRRTAGGHEGRSRMPLPWIHYGLVTDCLSTGLQMQSPPLQEEARARHDRYAKQVGPITAQTARRR